MLKILPSLLVALFLCLTAISASAQPQGEKNDLLSLSIGYFDFDDNDEAADLRVEYRWDAPILWQIEPWAGIEATTDGTLYGLGGLLIDLEIGEGFLMTPAVGVGLYAPGGGKDLGSLLQFRTQLEMGWRFENNTRAGIAVSHTSNAGTATPNPGAQVLSAYYHIPIKQ